VVCEKNLEKSGSLEMWAEEAYGRMLIEFYKHCLIDDSEGRL
jgi:hypothetical protein